MVSTALQEAVVGLSRDEKLALRDFIDITLSAAPELSEEQIAMISRRDAELDADPSSGEDWEQVYARLLAKLR